MSNDNPAAFDIFEGWSLYECIIAHNYMRHAEMVDAVAACAARCRAPLRVLDLGCGDAYLASAALKSARVKSYMGIDLSQSGLQRARQRMDSIADEVTVVESDIRAALDDPSEPTPSLVIASYALHHYRVSQQQELICRCYRTLSSGGLFVWIDCCRGKAETREAYLNRFIQTFLPTWTALTPDQLHDVESHMREADFPVSDDEKLAMAAAAGFECPEPLYADRYYAAHLFSRT